MLSHKFSAAFFVLSTLVIASASSAEEKTFTRTEDVIYGRKYGVALTMDVFTPPEPNGAGVIFVVSGGWYSAHEAINTVFFQPMLDRGYTVFAVVHGSQPKFTIPEILDDMHRAVRYIRHHAKDYDVDPDRLGIMGGSAGGHLSLMQGTAGKEGDPNATDPVNRESSRVQAVACLFPPTDFLNYGKEGEIGLGRGVLKGFRAPFDFQEMSEETKHFVEITDEAKILEIGKQISPVTHATADDPPMLIIHGDADELVPIQQAKLIVDKLHAAGVEAELVTKAGAGHGWPDFQADMEKFGDWFDVHLTKEAVAKAAESAPPADLRFEIPPTDEGLPGAGPIRRTDWFKQTWRERRAHFANRLQQDQGAVVFFGDSITQGWSDDFRGKFPGVKKANRGISGDTTRGMLVRLEEDVLSLKPRGVVMLMGTNDLDEKASPETIAGNVKLIVERLKKHDEKMPVVLCLVMPSSETKNRPAATIRKLNQRLAEEMKGEPQVTVLDTWTLFANKDGDAKVEEFPDLLHPNDAGYDKWAAALRPVLQTSNLMEARVDQFELEKGFELLFNGKDLTGWGYRPTSEKDLNTIKSWRERDANMPPWPIIKEPVWFDGHAASDDGRFIAMNGRLIVTTPSEGRRIQQLWTQREFPKDLVLRMDFRATPNADSGVYIRGPQLQCRDYVLAGPYKELKEYRPQKWNKLEVTVTAGVARATCNGELLEEKMEVPATGPIGVEGDRGQMEYRRIRVREM